MVQIMYNNKYNQQNTPGRLAYNNGKSNKRWNDDDAWSTIALISNN